MKKAKQPVVEDVEVAENSEDESDGEDDLMNFFGSSDESTTLTEEDKQRILREQMGVVEEEEEAEHHFTQQEIRSLQETQTLYQSSLFRLAFSEVLKQVAINWEKNKAIEIALHALKRALDEMRAGAVQVDSQIIFKEVTEGTTAPFSDLHRVWKAHAEVIPTVLSSPPENVAIVGSYLLRSVAKPHEHVDVAVTIPSELFDEKQDVKSHKYYVKRAAYLCLIAQHLKSYPMFETFDIVPYRMDLLKPIIVLTPKADEKLAPKFTRTKFQIRIFPVVANDALDRSQLDTNIINLETNTNSTKTGEQPDKKKKKVQKKPEETKENQPTPYHNHGILEDMYMFDHLQLLHTQLKDSPSLVETCTLLKVWSRQRVIYFNHDGVNGFLMTMLIVHLLMSGKINRHMSPFQVIKVFMTWITTNELKDVVINTGDDESGQEEAEVLEEMQKHFPLVVLDKARKFNLFHRVSAQAWKEMQHEAALTLLYLDEDRKSEAVKALFLEKHTFWNKYDIHLSVTNVSAIPLPERYNHDMGWNTYLTKQVTELLSKALAGRCKYVRVISQGPNTNKPYYQNDSLLFGLLLDTNWDATTTVGPSAAEISEREAFESFWGARAKMTQFKDGSLKMVVEWSQADTSIAILEEITKHVLSQHMRTEHVQILGKDIYTSLLKKQQKEDNMTKAFTTLRDTLTTLCPDNLNLEVRSVQVASPHYFGLSTTSNGVVNVVLEFFDNSRWPDEVEAISQLKKLIYIRLAQVLSTKGKRTCLPHEHWIDVNVNSVIFRVVIVLHKELHIYKTSGMALDERVLRNEKMLVHVPMHYQAMDLFRSTHPAFVQTVQLAKHWMNSHLFSDHIDERLIEVLCAHAFVYHYPYEVPKTSVCAFMRFIHLLASHAWHESPLLVDLTDDKEDDESETKRNVQVREAKKKKKERLDNEMRQLITEHEEKPLLERAPMSVYVSYDGIDLTNYWTSKESPSRVITNRLIQHAKHTDFLLGQLYATPLYSTDWHGTLFNTAMKGFDVLLRMKQSDVIAQECKKLVKGDKMSLAGFDPVEMFIKDINAKFGGKMLLFRNASRNDIIALVWNPAFFVPSKLRIDRCSGIAIASNGLTVLNTFEVLDQITKLGEGLIESVQFLQQTEASRLPTLRTLPAPVAKKEKAPKLDVPPIEKVEKVLKSKPEKKQNLKRKRT